VIESLRASCNGNGTLVMVEVATVTSRMREFSDEFK